MLFNKPQSYHIRMNAVGKLSKTINSTNTFSDTVHLQGSNRLKSSHASSSHKRTQSNDRQRSNHVRGIRLNYASLWRLLNSDVLFCSSVKSLQTNCTSEKSSFHAAFQSKVRFRLQALSTLSFQQTLLDSFLCSDTPITNRRSAAGPCVTTCRLSCHVDGASSNTSEAVDCMVSAVQNLVLIISAPYAPFFKSFRSSPVRLDILVLLVPHPFSLSPLLDLTCRFTSLVSLIPLLCVFNSQAPAHRLLFRFFEPKCVLVSFKQQQQVILQSCVR